MELKIQLDGLDPKELTAQVQVGMYTKLYLSTKQPVSKISQAIFPFIALFQYFPMLQAYILPKYLKQPQYDVVALGGTFDYFHIGHQILLLEAIQLAKKQIIVGITGDLLLGKKKNKSILQDLATRQDSVIRYIKMIKPELIITTPELQEPYGPTIVRKDIQAIVVSKQTYKGAQQINKIRNQAQFTPLKIHICQMISPISQQNIDRKLSSSDIRSHILSKNQLTEEQLESYKSSWFTLTTRIAQLLKIQEKELFQAVANKFWIVILYKYSEYWRHYHTNHHIYDMLSQYKDTKIQLQQRQRIALQIGIWFHDIEYLPSDDQNQEKSWLMAENFISEIKQTIGTQQCFKILDSIRVDTKSAILSTKHHKTQKLVDKVLIDIDMSVLNSPTPIYQKYAQNIEKQYAPILKAEYPKKRLEFLQNLDLNSVFYFKPNIENMKVNVEWEIQSLKKTIQSDEL